MSEPVPWPYRVGHVRSDYNSCTCMYDSDRTMRLGKCIPSPTIMQDNFTTYYTLPFLTCKPHYIHIWPKAAAAADPGKGKIGGWLAGRNLLTSR